MASSISTRYFARFASAALVVIAAVALRGEPARACGGWGGPSYYDFMTFDPAITGDVEGIYFDPMLIGFGDPCSECGVAAMTTDWHGYFKGAVSDADWKQVLFPENQNAVVAIRSKLAGKGDRAHDALAYVDLAHRVEPFASMMSDAPVPGALLVDAQASFRAARDRFLQQRYAFLVLRIMFYQHDWANAVAFYDKTAATLAAPSADLAWRARYYVAGASRRAGNRARANLELARVHAGYPALAAATANDFKPLEDTDWHESLKLARDVKDKIALWRLVGVRTDGLVAAREVLKLDPRSDQLALLLVRELARAEVLGEPIWGSPADPKEAAERNKAFTVLDKIATKVIATPGADRPWIAELVLGHMAAKRGDVAATRAHLERAVQLRPNDPRVTNQAKASLALALSKSWAIDPAREDELARTINAIGSSFGRLQAVRVEVRDRLAEAYVKAGRIVDAEFLHAGSAGKRWLDRTFIEQMIARSTQLASEFDKFVVTGAIERAQLDRELASRDVLDGNFAAAQPLFAKLPVNPLGTDPFVIHIRDCHECDQEKFAKSAWTHRTVVARMLELQKAAGGQGEAAANAAIELGNAFYNLTWFGNARVFLESTHQRTADTRMAERWYKRAFDLSKNRETKAKAAWLAAKSELGRLENLDVDSPWGGYGNALPTPKLWFPIMRTFADTKYYKQVIAECTRFRDFVGTK